MLIVDALIQLYEGDVDEESDPKEPESDPELKPEEEPRWSRI